MNEKDAKRIAKILGGEPYHSGGNIWLVILQKDPTIILLGETGIEECASWDAYYAGAAINSISWDPDEEEEEEDEEDDEEPSCSGLPRHDPSHNFLLFSEANMTNRYRCSGCNLEYSRRV